MSVKCLVMSLSNEMLGIYDLAALPDKDDFINFKDNILITEQYKTSTFTVLSRTHLISSDTNTHICDVVLVVSPSL